MTGCSKAAHACVKCSEHKYVSVIAGMGSVSTPKHLHQLGVGLQQQAVRMQQLPVRLHRPCRVLAQRQVFILRHEQQSVTLGQH